MSTDVSFRYWFGSKVGQEDVQQGRASPTYVYPSELVAEIRRRFPGGDVGARDDVYHPGAAGVHVVTWAEMKTATWPPPPKGCELCCKARRSKPY